VEFAAAFSPDLWSAWVQRLNRKKNYLSFSTFSAEALLMIQQTGNE